MCNITALGVLAKVTELQRAWNLCLKVCKGNKSWKPSLIHKTEQRHHLRRRESTVAVCRKAEIRCFFSEVLDVCSVVPGLSDSCLAQRVMHEDNTNRAAEGI